MCSRFRRRTWEPISSSGPFPPSLLWSSIVRTMPEGVSNTSFASDSELLIRAPHWWRTGEAPILNQLRKDSITVINGSLGHYGSLGHCMIFPPPTVRQVKFVIQAYVKHAYPS